MRGGSYLKPPLGYVELQKQVNSFHSNGQVETESDFKQAELSAKLVWEAAGGTPASIVSFGCRTGYELEQFSGTPTRAGVDVVPAFIELGRKNRPDYRLEVADMSDKLPFSDGEFEWGICMGTLEHCWNLERAASEMQRVLQRGLLVTADLRRKVERSDFAASLRPSEWLALFERRGWTLGKAWVESPEDRPGLFMVWRRT